MSLASRGLEGRGDEQEQGIGRSMIASGMLVLW
jgi:hypothetical protein